MIENGAKVLYTGDLNLNGGLLTAPADTPKCDILIIEATFGAPRYRFPEKGEVVEEMRDWAEDSLSSGKIPVFLGYTMGKAQELTRALSPHFTTYVDEQIHKLNDRVEKIGFHLGEYSLLDESKLEGDCVIIAPPHRANLFFRKNFSTALASGWTADWGGGSRFYSAGFPFSDHSDFYSLTEFVERVSPQAVYTVHGFANELSRHLRERGFYSEPLSEVQKKLDDF